MSESVYQNLHTAIQERANTQYGGGGGAAASRIAEEKRERDTRDTLKKATRVLLEITRKQEDALKKHLQRAADPQRIPRTDLPLPTYPRRRSR